MSRFSISGRFALFNSVDLYQNFQKMKNSQNTPKFMIKSGLSGNPNEVYTLRIKDLEKDLSGGNGEWIIVSYTGNIVSGYLVLQPMYSHTGKNSEEAVVFSKIVYASIGEGKMLVREGLMRSWELGNLVAFALDKDPVFMEAGFQKVTSKLIHSEMAGLAVLFKELKWQGMKRISGKLVIPTESKPIILN